MMCHMVVIDDTECNSDDIATCDDTLLAVS